MQTLLNICDYLFNLPIIIIAQNWKDQKFSCKDLILYTYEDKLGITGARKELRKKFLESTYDYLIMLDDDCTLIGSSGKNYLQQIDNNPGCFIEFKKTLLKLFAISKELIAQVDFADVSPEKGEGFEDRIFVNTLRKKFPDKQRLFVSTGIMEHSISTADVYSTWYAGQNLKNMLKNTFDIIDNIE